ncbi:hypothetical protein Caci_2544 [Catenulispora acidiphila DSM 44928]|uniref:Uncharacterized protein n=1 Tax=Catenulispora acidiphila (strain DSM 44928 / JCM 14897 / NBRC 102108 / NRRL B-24433 / ID139908) TaxID=479433 RepID=C7PXK9_CATAD|nr:hypothetical protein [Catenulispora acidiphila]ACU71462.1 hypothetical protein Caci_2544 [Catenulispora acidiphila DSM 44928]
MIDAERRAALHQAMIDRDFPVIEEALRGDDLALRRAALRAVRTLPVADDAAAAVLADASLELRRAFYRTLFHARRTALADRLLPAVRQQWGDGEAAAVLPACSADVAAERLPELAHAVGSWTALTRRHPDVVMAYIESGDPALGLPGYPYFRRWGNVLAILAESLPMRTIALLNTHDARYGLYLPSRAMTAMAKADPVGSWPVVAADGRRRAAQRYCRALAALDDAEIIAYADGDAHALCSVLEEMPPARREGLVDAFVAAAPELPPMWAEPLLSVLPPARAAAEARRMLEWYRPQWHASRRRSHAEAVELLLASYLPSDEAVPVLTDAAASGTSAVRKAARALLLRHAADTGAGAEVLRQVEALVPRVVNEPDPVRGFFLESLVTLPVAVFSDEWVPVLEQLTAVAIQARDSSQQTRRSLRILARRTLRHQTSPGLVVWALDVYRRLVARFGAAGLAVPSVEELNPPVVRRRRRRGYRPDAPPDDWRLDLALLPGQERELVAVLRPWLDDEAVVRDLRRALGRRAENCAELPAVVGDEAVLAVQRGEAVVEASGSSAESAEVALSRLLAEANGARSPEAVAALAACCARVRPSVLGPALVSALFASDSKVTLRKQVVHQLRRNRVPGHLDVLLRAWQQPDTHRDVRVAIAVVLRGATEDPRALDAVAAAVGPEMSELMIRTLFQPHPRQYPPEARAAYARIVRNLLRASDDGGVRFRGLKAFAVWAPWYRGGVDELVDTLFGPDPDEADLASELIRALIATGSATDRAPDLLRRLADDPTQAKHASPLTHTIANLRGGYQTPEPWTLDLVEQCLAALASDPRHARRALDLALALVDPTADDLATRLTTYANLLTDRPYLAGTSERRLQERIARHLGDRPPPHLLLAAQTLAQRGDLAGGLVAGQLANAVITHETSDASWHDIIATLRASPHPEVADAARDIGL